MRIIADLHIHSKYSRAVSPKMDIDHISEWAKIKGIDIVGTGDFTHFKWIAEIKEKLVEDGTGLLTSRDDYKQKFMLTSEISCIYKQGSFTDPNEVSKCRKIHLVILAPTIATVQKINTALAQIGNIHSDGRPILGISAYNLAKLIFAIDERCMVIPAHAWTPWFSVFGSKSGFDSIEACFGDLTPKIYAIETGLSCYDDQTEILTNHGWQFFKDVQYKDKICTLNIESNQIEFQNPEKIYTNDYHGKMYKLKTKRIDLLVTPNHRLLVSHCDFRKEKKFQLIEAEKSFNKSKRFKKDGDWIGKNEDFFILPAVRIKHGSRFYSGTRVIKEKSLSMKEWLKFFGLWVAEGWTSLGKDGDYNVCLANTNSKLLHESGDILSKFGYKVFYSEYTFRVRDFQLFSYLKKFGKCYEKHVPEDIKALSKQLLNIFFEYYIKGDGHIYGRTKKGLSATTNSIKLRDDLQEIALKLGMSAYYKMGVKKGTPIKSFPPYKTREDVWAIYFIRMNIHTVIPSTIKKWGYTESWVDFIGKVFCVKVPNHTVYVRRNGIPVWCGNSDPEMNWRLSKLDNITLISNSDAHSMQNLGREANVFELDENKINYDEICDIIKTKDKKRFPATLEFFPEEGKYHFDGHANCEFVYDPFKDKYPNDRCPKCNRPMTIGVASQVQKLADREVSVQKKSFPNSIHLVPLREIIANSFGVGVQSKKVNAEYDRLIHEFGSEFHILLDLDEKYLIDNFPEKIAQGIINVKNSDLTIDPGYDGIFGKVHIF